MQSKEVGSPKSRKIRHSLIWITIYSSYQQKLNSIVGSLFIQNNYRTELVIEEKMLQKVLYVMAISVFQTCWQPQSFLRLTNHNKGILACQFVQYF